MPPCTSWVWGHPQAWAPSGCCCLPVHYGVANGSYPGPTKCCDEGVRSCKQLLPAGVDVMSAVGSGWGKGHWGRKMTSFVWAVLRSPFTWGTWASLQSTVRPEVVQLRCLLRCAGMSWRKAWLGSLGTRSHPTACPMECVSQKAQAGLCAATFIETYHVVKEEICLCCHRTGQVSCGSIPSPSLCPMAWSWGPSAHLLCILQTANTSNKLVQGEGPFLTQSHLCFKLKFSGENLDLMFSWHKSWLQGSALSGNKRIKRNKNIFLL